MSSCPGERDHDRAGRAVDGGVEVPFEEVPEISKVDRRFPG